MKSLSQSSSHRKPVGGVRSVVLTATDNVAEALFAASGTLCTSLNFVDEGALMECELLEESSCFEEKLSSESGVVSVAHNLVLVAERNVAEEWLAPEFRTESLKRGLCAVVTLNNGCRLLVGYSERFGAQQPLRVVSIKSSSGTRRTDPPTVTLTLENFDTSIASVIVTD